MKNETISSLQNILHREKDFDSELFISSGKSQEVSLKEGALENVDFSSWEGMGLRIFRDKKSAFAYSNTVDGSELETLFRKTKNIIKFAEPDPARILPEIETAKDGELDIFDEDIFKPRTAEITDLLKEESSKAVSFDRSIKKVIRAACSQSESQTVIMNSKGFSASEKSTGGSFGISVIAESSADTQTGSSYISKRYFKDIEFDKATKEACWMAGALLNAGKIPSGRRSIIMHPSIAVEFMDLISSALSADAVQKKRSFLAGYQGSRAASENLTLIDDPHMHRGMASSVFDDEGIPTRKMEIIKQGILQNIYYDSYTAFKDGIKSTGNASRGAYKGLPSPGSSNLYIQPGKKPLEELIKDAQTGVYVLDVMGMHMVDTISGDFSVGISGLSIEKGCLSKSVRGLTLAGNLRQFLANIKEAGNDIIFYGGSGSPSILIEDLMIGG